MSSRILVYGSYGYTGRLVVNELLGAGIKPVLAGRTPGRVSEQGTEYSLSPRIFDSTDLAKIDGHLKDVALVVNCAGPFVHTARDLAKACIRTRTHYIDITGELAVFESLAGLTSIAEEAGTMILPGVGFDVVAGDCLAAYLKSRLPSATHLKLAISTNSPLSDGTKRTILEHLGSPPFVRADGKRIQARSQSMSFEVDFGDGKRKVLVASMGELTIAYFSTGIPNIETYVELPFVSRELAVLGRYLPWLVKSGPVRMLLSPRAGMEAVGPTNEEQASTLGRIWGEVQDATGARATARLNTPNPYTLTAELCKILAEKVLSGEFQPGFQTPSRVYGADFVLECSGVSRVDC